jgi:hypothetical protein
MHSLRLSWYQVERYLPPRRVVAKFKSPLVAKKRRDPARPSKQRKPENLKNSALGYQHPAVVATWCKVFAG